MLAAFDAGVRHVEQGALIGASTSPAEALFATRLVGHEDHLALAEMPAPAEPGAPGWFLPLVDLVLGRTAMRHTFGNGTCVTVSLSLEFHHPVLRPGSVVCALGRTVSDEGDTMSTTVEVRTETGELVAHGHGRFLMVDGPPPAPVPDLAGADNSAVLGRLLGIDDMVVTGDGVRHELIPGGDLANPSGVVHGGAQGAMLMHAMDLVARHRRPGADLMSLTIDFRGPVVISDDPMAVQARIVRAGVHLVTTEAEIVISTGRSATWARGIHRAGAAGSAPHSERATT
jgi:acyl-coenzyme A thioesterase PaaI-like protein